MTADGSTTVGKNDEGKASSSPILFQTKVRQLVFPYLPPPVIHTITDVVDPQLEPFVGPEGTITVGGTLLVAWLVLQVVRFLSTRVTGAGRAIADDDDDDDDEDNILSKAAKKMEYDRTVLLCGPVNAGKTRLFYHVCYGTRDMPTLMSLKANVGLSSNNSRGSDSSSAAAAAVEKEEVVRYMDWPGSASLSDPAFLSILQSNPRIVFCLDATQPVAGAADILYPLLTYFYSTHSRSRSKNTNNNSNTIHKPTIFVACHKKDFPKAKNDKRIKIQMRTELERLLAAKAAVSGKGSDGGSNSSSNNKRSSEVWWPAGEPLELDELPFCKLAFYSTTCEGKGCPQLVEFCRTGSLPEE